MNKIPCVNYAIFLFYFHSRTTFNYEQQKTSFKTTQKYLKQTSKVRTKTKFVIPHRLFLVVLDESHPRKIQKQANIMQMSWLRRIICLNIVWSRSSRLNNITRITAESHAKIFGNEKHENKCCEAFRGSNSGLG